jgi:hypothetical protein
VGAGGVDRSRSIRVTHAYQIVSFFIVNTAKLHLCYLSLEWEAFPDEPLQPMIHAPIQGTPEYPSSLKAKESETQSTHQQAQ